MNLYAVLWDSHGLLRGVANVGAMPELGFESRDKAMFENRALHHTTPASQRDNYGFSNCREVRGKSRRSG